MKYSMIAVILSLFTIQFPLTVNIFISFFDKKIYIKISLFKAIKIKSLYANLSGGKIFFHLTDKKSIMFSPSQIIPDKKNLDITNAFAITKINYSLILNARDDLAAFVVLTTINCLNAAIYSHLKEKRPFLNFKGNSIISEKSDINGIVADIGMCFSVLSILIVALKSVFKGGKNG